MPLCTTCRDEAETTQVTAATPRWIKVLSSVFSDPSEGTQSRECSRCARRCDECGGSC